MATNYPSGLDSLSNPAGSDALSTGHASQHANANDAIEAIEGELGLNPRGGSATVKARIDAIEANSWVTSARIADATITGTDIASGTITSTNILDGTILNADINAAAAIDISKISGGVTSAGVGNLLTTNQASVETDTTGLGKTSNSAVARTTATALAGSASLAVTCTGAGAWTAGASTLSVADQVPVVAGQVYTGVIYSKAAATPRAMYANLRFATTPNAQVSIVSGTAATNSTSGWTAHYVTAVAPAAATYVQVYMISDVTPAADEVHYLDCLGVWKGAGGLWSLPGTPIANLGTYTDESVGRRIFTWDTVNSRWQQTYGDTGIRNVSASLTGTSAGTVYMVREGNLVSLVITGLVVTTPAGGWNYFYDVPAGFQPPTNVETPLRYGYTSGTNHSFGIIGNKLAGLETLSGGAGGYTGLINYRTNQAWPTTLPGTAVGTIPQ